MPLSQEQLDALRHPKETPRFILTLFVLLPVGLLVALLTVVTFGGLLLLVPVVLFMLWLSLKLFVASFMNNTVLVTEKSFPVAHAAIREAQNYFGYYGQIDAYVYQNGDYNASLMPLLNTKVLLLNSELMVPQNNPDEVRFLIGRFVGALASKHFRFMWLQAFLSAVERLAVFNILLYPYERALKLSGDRMGLAMINGDIRVAMDAMMKLVVGPDVADQVSVSSFMEQGARNDGRFFRWLVKAFSTFPHHTTRVSELITYAKKEYPQRFRKRRAAG